MEEEGCVAEALHDEVSIYDDYHEVVVVIVDEDNDDKDDTSQARIFCVELPMVDCIPLRMKAKTIK